jgi:predicted CoA-binding protein
MNHAPSDEEIRALLASRPTIAIVGASSRPDRPSHGVMNVLLDAGYDVTPVNPNESVVLGRTAYPDLRALPTPIDLVDVFRRPEHVPGIARQAVAVGARALWTQLGVVSEEGARIARDGGLFVVMNHCTAIEHERLIGRAFPSPSDAVGLCETCRHARVVETPRSRFWMCERAATDPSFDKYPRLPRLACRGFEPKS